MMVEPAAESGAVSIYNNNSNHHYNNNNNQQEDDGGGGGMETNVYSNEMMGDNRGNWADDTIERSSNLFSQLDSMIAAVQTESSALDTMREKLRELDGMRSQLSSLTKRLLEADQANLTLKSNMVKIQEAYADLRRTKQELESTMVPLRQELNRSKDMYGKERMARLSAQQETSMLKDQLLRLEKINEDLEREVKTIPSLADSNELMKAGTDHFLHLNIKHIHAYTYTHTTTTLFIFIDTALINTNVKPQIYFKYI